MNSLNSILLEGNLTRDPVLHETPKGTPVCSLGLAVNRYYKQDDETVQEVSFFEIEAWTTLARYVTSQFKKGSPMRVVGRLKQERWEDAEGNSRSKVKVIGEHVEPIVAGKNGGGKNASDSGEAGDSAAAESAVDEAAGAEGGEQQGEAVQEELLV